jgi:hypothetical protein
LAFRWRRISQRRKELLAGPSPASKAELTRLGLAVVDDYGNGHSMQKPWEATWTLKTTHFRRRTFPAELRSRSASL